MLPEFSYIINTLFTIFSFVLIILMVPGFAMLEGGIVRTKNVTTVLMINTMVYAFASLSFLIIGYHIAFQGDPFSTFSELEGQNMSKWAMVIFQMAFVGKVINIMNGGISERTKIIPLTFFAIIMASLLYPLVVNITWGSNLLKDTFLEISLYDLAGSTVIHSTGGWALLAAILIIGARKGRYPKRGGVRVIPASNIPLVTLGAFLLWIGWFGFNAGSLGAIDTKEGADMVALTILNTNTAGLSGAIISGALMLMKYKKLDITMVLNGALGGLVSITAAPNLYDVYEPIIIGAIGGMLVVFAVPFFDKLKLDDPVGALSVHLVNGIWGTLAVAIFASNPDEGITLFGQIKGIVIVAIFAFVSSYIVLSVINKIIPLRTSNDEELEGLDVNECGVEAYPEFKRAF